MALVSNQFTYLDGTFVMIFFIFCILDIMGIKIRRLYLTLWTLLGVFFLLIPFTASHNELFYTSYKLVYDYGASHLTMEFGPLHAPFMVFVVINTILPIIVVIFSFFSRKEFHTKYLLCCLYFSFALFLYTSYSSLPILSLIFFHADMYLLNMSFF